MARLRRRTWVINGVLILMLLAAGGAAYYFLTPHTSDAADAPRTVTVSTGTVAQTVSASGTLQSAAITNVDFAASGTVSEILVKAGDNVTAGQPLARLDATDANNQLDVAETQLNAALSNLTNAQNKLNAAPANTDTSQLTAAVYQQQVAVKQARASVANANKAIANTTLTAPVAGTVTVLNGVIGKQVGGGGASSSSNGSSNTGNTGSQSSGNTGNTSANSTSTSSFVQLADLSRLQVRAQFSEVDVAKLKADQTATVTLNAVPGQTIDAKVAGIDVLPTTSNGVVTYAATLSVGQLPSGARHGQTASITVIVARADNALLLPSATVQTAGGQSSVTVLRNGQQQRVNVTLGVKGDSTVQITDGLADGDQVVLPGTSSSTRGTNQRNVQTGQFPGTGGVGGVRPGTGGNAGNTGGGR